MIEITCGGVDILEYVVLFSAPSNQMIHVDTYLADIYSQSCCTNVNMLKSQ